MQRKKYNHLFLFFIICCLMFSVGCGKQHDTKEVMTAEVKEAVLEMTNMHCMDADDQGGLYVGAFSDDEHSLPYIMLVGQDGAEKIVQTEFFEEHRVGAITAILYDNGEENSGEGRLYVAVDEWIENGKSRAALYLLDLKTGKYTQEGSYDGYTGIRKIVKMDQEIYFLIKGEKEAERKPVPAGVQEIFDYAGEVIMSQNGEVLFDDFPTACEQTGSQELLIYAHEDGEGFYFQPVTVKKNSWKLGEKVRKDLGQVTSITMTEEERFIYTARSFYVNGLMEISLSDEVENELISERGVITSPGDICYKNGIVYYHTEQGIAKFDYALCKKENKVLNVIQTETVGLFSAPFGCGYRMITDRKNQEEMALAVLSQDQGYDLCCMQSGDSFGWNVREKGSFYPLTEVDGVEEYLSACFPYLREAATDPDGEIWMLPVSVSAYQFLYDRELLKEYGVSWEHSPNLEQFLDAAKSIKEQGGAELMNVPGTMLERTILRDYADRNESFDTETFRRLAGMLEAVENKEPFVWHDLAEQALTRHEQKFLCGLESMVHTYPSIMGNPYVSAERIPGTEMEEPMGVQCYFLCVNASSGNLDAALDYIGTLSYYLLQQKDSMMLKDREMYTDMELTESMYALYENGEVVFSIPEDLYEAVWDEYRAGKIDLEQMIQEADRKIAMYKKE